MSNSKPNQNPPGSTVGAGASAAQPGVPTALPPNRAASQSKDCGCKGHAATSAARTPVLVGAPSNLQAPTLVPSAVGAAQGVTATWQSNVHVTGMWSINQDRNCWAHLDSVGWRNLSGVSESGLVSLNMLASHAYQTGAVASLYEEDDGRISQIYVW